ncbi:MAG: hypothetical protein JNJ56_14385, partial [Ignavibacteria bacterium]|nr:hypothetical protein [Ignavibacteria bacterium]
TPLPNYPDIVAAAWTYGGEFNLWRPLFRFNLTGDPVECSYHKRKAFIICKSGSGKRSSFRR